MQINHMQVGNGNLSFWCDFNKSSVKVKIYCTKSIYYSGFSLTAKCKINTLFKLIGSFGHPVKIKVIKCTEKPITLDLLTLI